MKFTECRSMLRACVRHALFAGAAVSAYAFTAGASLADDGWFSEEQVERGKNLYEKRCSTCHGDEKAENFRIWDDTAESLIAMIRSFDMPADRPGGLPAQEYVDIVAYVFNLGGLPTGEEVDARSAALSEIKIPQ